MSDNVVRWAMPFTFERPFTRSQSAKYPHVKLPEAYKVPLPPTRRSRRCKAIPKSILRQPEGLLPEASQAAERTSSLTMCYADLEHNRPVMTIFAGELSSLGADVLAITGIWKDDLDSLQRNLIGYIGKFKPRRRQQLHDGVLVNTNRLTVIEDEAFFVDTELNKATGCSKITCPEVAVIVVATMNGSSESVKMAIISPSTVSTLRDLQVSALVNKVERMKKADSLPIVICGVATANLEKLKSENKQKLSWQSVEGTKSGTGDTGVLYTKNNKLELKSFMPAVPSSAFQDDFLPLPYQFTLSDFNLLKDQGTLKRSLEQDESADATKTKKKVHGF